MSVSVIIPSVPARTAMLRQALDGIHTLTDVHAIEVEIIVALDSDAAKPEFPEPRYIKAANQSAKINVGVEAATEDIIAILHDDDLWHPDFLKIALEALKNADFVSSTSLQTDEDNEVIGVQDCPVPSGWVFRKQTFQAVGPWNENCRFHPDSEWLGRLGEVSTLRRAHLIERYAPAPRIRIGGERRYNSFAQRPGMLALLQQARPTPTLLRHPHAVPLVNHRQHGAGIMQRINEPERWAQSQWEYQRLSERFGRIPW